MSKVRFVVTPKLRDDRPLASKQEIHNATKRGNPRSIPEQYVPGTYRKPGNKSQTALRVAGLKDLVAPSDTISPMQTLRAVFRNVSPRMATAIKGQ